MTNLNKSQAVSMNLLISIIITSYTMERLKDICELFDSIKAQTYPNIEVIFIAERSSELYEKVKEYGEKLELPRFKLLLNEGELGLSAARNLGVMNAKGEIIGFVDDDVLLLPEWAEEVTKSFEDDSIIGVTGPAILLWEDKSMGKWFPNEFSWIVGGTSWENWKDEIQDIRNVGGMNHAFKKEAFSKAGLYIKKIGFQESEKVKWNFPSGEEVELSLRVRKVTGKRVVFNPRMKIYHKVPQTKTGLNVLAKRAYRLGYSRHMAKKLYSGSVKGKSTFLNPEHKVLRRILLRLFPNIFLEFFRHPSIAWMKFLVTFIGTFFTVLGYLVYFVKPFPLEGKH